MRRLALALVVCLPAGDGGAAPGDRLEVLGDRVEVRRAARADAEVVLLVERGEPAIELRRWDVWVAVDLPRRRHGGWIHTSLLGPAAVTADHSAKVVEKRDGESEALRRFRNGLGHANRQYRTADGPLPFVGARAGGPGAVSVVVRRAWMAHPAALRERELDQLFARWRAAAGGDGPLRLEIIDPSGHVLMSKSLSDLPALSLADEEN